MASELVVVSSPLEQLVNSVIENGHNGFIVPFQDVIELVKILRRIADNHKKMKDVQKRARATVIDRFNWKRVAQDTIAAIEDLLYKN